MASVLTCTCESFPGAGVLERDVHAPTLRTMQTSTHDSRFMTVNGR